MNKITNRNKRNLIITIFIIIIIVMAIALSDNSNTEDSTGINNNTQGTLKEYADLNSSEYRIGCPTGTLYDYVAKVNFPNARTVYGETMEEMPEMLSNGKIDAYVTRVITLPYVFETHKDLTFFPQYVFSLSPAFFSSTTNKGKALISSFDRFYNEMCSNGEYQKMRDKWESYSENPEDKEMPVYNYSGINGTLNVAVNSAEFPYDYHDGKDYKGLFVEMVNTFCAKHGYRPKYYTVDLTAAIIGVISGKYDLYAGDVSSSDELKEKVTFTQDFAVSDEVAVVRKSSVDPAVQEENEKLMGLVYITETKNVSAVNVLKESIVKTFIKEQRWSMILKGLLITVALAVCSALVGTALGVGVCYVRRKNSEVLKVAGDAYIFLFESIPVLVLLLILNYLVFGKAALPPFWICVSAFGMNYAAFMADITGRGIDSIPEGQYLAAVSLGYSKRNAFRRIILPQVINEILPEYRLQLITLVNTTSLAGYISVQDITKAAEIIKSRTFEALFPLICTAIIYFILAWLLASALKIITRKFDPDLRRTLPKGAKL